ncbi:MAG: hypothetical protein AAGA12_08550 [Pseudomonadota bacterium]
MQKSGRAYAFGASGFLFSNLVSVIAGVVSLWLLTRILSTDQFAGYVVAMSILALIGFNAGLAVERVLVLKLAELPVRQGRLAGLRMLRRVLFLASVPAFLALAGILVYARVGGNEAVWLSKMALLVPLMTLGVVLSAWFQANHKIGTSALMSGITDGSRCLFFVIIYLTSIGANAVAAAAVLAAAIPIFVLVLLARGNSDAEPDGFNLEDYIAGLKFLVIRLSQMGLRQFDIIIVGLTLSSLETAYYAVAARLSAIGSVGYQAFSRTYAPRLRNNLAAENWSEIEHEFHAVRVLSVLATLIAATAFFAFGEYALKLFGDLQDGYPALVILMAAQVITALFGVHIEHLSMSGHLNGAIVLRVMTTLLFVVLLVLLVPGFGTTGAASAAVIAAVAYGVSVSVFVNRLKRPSQKLHLVLVIAAISAATMIGASFLPSLWGGGLLVLIFAILTIAFLERSTLIRFASLN